jgi:hypothetical protein
MKRLRLCLVLVLAVGCAHPAAAPPPVLQAAPPPAAPVAPLAFAPVAPSPAAPPPVAAAPGHESAPLEVPPSTRIRIGCGFLLVENHGPTAFSLVLPATKPMQSKTDPSVVLLDGILVQSAATTAPEMGAARLSGHELLRHQMLWQANLVAQGQGWPNLQPTGDPIDLGLGGNLRTWFWGLDAPAAFEVEGVKVNRVAHLSVAVDDVVLTLASPLRPQDDFRPAARVMSRAMRSLRRSPTPIDVFALQDAALAGKLDPEFCARVEPS